MPEHPKHVHDQPHQMLSWLSLLMILGGLLTSSIHNNVPNTGCKSPLNASTCCAFGVEFDVHVAVDV